MTCIKINKLILDISQATVQTTLKGMTTVLLSRKYANSNNYDRNGLIDR